MKAAERERIERMGRDCLESAGGDVPAAARLLHEELRSKGFDTRLERSALLLCELFLHTLIQHTEA